MSPVQMNVRIDSELKEQGDKVFASLGYSPSQVVRSIWEYAAQHRESPAIVEKMMHAPAGEINNIEKELRHIEIAQGRRIIGSFLEQYGISYSARPDDYDYSSALETALTERMNERGLL